MNCIKFSDSDTVIQIEVEIQKIMPLLCKDCNGRRFPIAFPDQRDALWLCEKCKNFVNSEDFIVREAKLNECEDSQEDYKKWVKSIPPTDGTKDSFRY